MKRLRRILLCALGWHEWVEGKSSWSEYKFCKHCYRHG